MRYFLIETDETNKIPYSINKNRAIDIRLLTKEDVHKIPLWNVMTMNLPSEVFFPDIICSPCILLSKMCMTANEMYQPLVQYRMVKLWERESSVNATYYIPILDEVDCLSEKTQFNTSGNQILNMILSKNKIGSNIVFKIKGLDIKGFIGRMDYVESIIRRGVQGIKLKEIETDEG